MIQKENIDYTTFLPPTLCFNFFNKNFQSLLQALFDGYQKIERNKAKEKQDQETPRVTKSGISIVNSHDFGIDDILAENGLSGNLDAGKVEELRFPECFDNGFNLWILKPSDFCRGCGLELVNSLQGFSENIRQFYRGFQIKDFDKFQLKRIEEDEQEDNHPTPKEIVSYKTEEKESERGSHSHRKSTIKEPMHVKTVEITFPAVHQNRISSKQTYFQKMDNFLHQQSKEVEAASQIQSNSKQKDIKFPNDT